MCSNAARFVLPVLIMTCLPLHVAKAQCPGDSEVILSSIDSFLERQLDRFLPLPSDYPLEFQSAQLVQTYDVEESDPEFGSIYHRADTYDSALAAFYFLKRGDIDRARDLLDGVVYMQELDPDFDPPQGCPNRESYWANDLLSPNRIQPSIDNWRKATGNMAWQIIALTQFYCSTGEQEYLEAAMCMADWIQSHTEQPMSASDEFGGYSMGEEQDGSPISGFLEGRSIEHNVGVYVAATNLYVLTKMQKYDSMATHAQHFVQLMFDDAGGKYWLGTKRHETTGEIVRNYYPIAADAQTWTTLASIDEESRAIRALGWLTEPTSNIVVKDITCDDNSCQDPCQIPCASCYSDGATDDCCYYGTRFTNHYDARHVQCEMTASATMALCLIDDQAAAEEMLCNLDRIRLTAPGSDPGGVGIVATPWCDGAPTGFAGAVYPNKRHVASTVWGGLAVMVFSGEPAANPLQPLLLGDCNDDGMLTIDDVGDFIDVLLEVDQTACHLAKADMNSDNSVDGRDIGPFIAAVPSSY